MTDKELIKQEIERRIDLYSIAEKENSTFACMGALSSIIDYIDSLPKESGCEVNFTTKSEDLEEAMELSVSEEPLLEFFATGQPTIGAYNEDSLRNQFEAGAEWQKQQMKEALQTEYEKGRFDMREEMLKNTVLETKVMMDCDGDGIETPYEEWLTLENTEILYIPDNLGLKEGDKVKIIIIKSEQQ